MALTVTSAAAVASSTSSTATTASFTPAVGEWLVVAAVGGSTSSSAVTLTISDSRSGTWTQRKFANLTSPGGAGGGSAVGIWTRSVASALSTTVTVTVSGGTPNAAGLQVWRVSGSGITFGASGSGAASTTNITPTAFTSTRAGSTLVAAGSEWSGGSTMTSSDLTYSSFSNAAMEGSFGWKTLGATGSQTFNMSAAGGGGLWYWTAIELYSSGVTGDVAQTITATDSVDGRVTPVRGDVSQTITATTAAAGSYGAVGAVAQTITATAAVSGAVRKPPFPLAPLPVRVFLALGGEVVDVTDWTRGTADPPITITRGRTGEGARTERSTCTLTFDNRDGRFSPRNPRGAWYGLIGRNTPLVVEVTEGGPYLSINAIGDYATCPDSPALSITGDLDVRVDLRAYDWAAGTDLAGKGRATAGTLSWDLVVVDRYLHLLWSTDGTTVQTAVSTAALPVGSFGRVAVRATIDVDNGASGWTAGFSYAATMAGPWRQLGDPVTGAGTTSLFDSTAPVQVGDIYPGSSPPVPGHYYAAEIRAGGTLVASPDFRAQIVDADAFFDDQGNLWSVAGGAALSAVHGRFHGEVPEWPSKWDKTGKDATVTVQAAGVLRRLGQGQAPLSSTLRRALTSLTPAPVAYWPAEEGQYATSVGSALGGPAMVVTTGAALTPGRFGASTLFAASAALPTVEETVWTGPVPAYTATGQTQLRFLLGTPTSGTLALDQAVIARLTATGSVTRWDVQYGTTGGGAVRVVAYNASGTAVLTTAWLITAINGRAVRVSVGLTESGGSVACELVTLEAGANSGLVLGGTVTGTVGTVTTVEINSTQQLGSTVVGHISLETEVTSVFDVSDQLDAYRTEAAGRRFTRLCAENGIPVALVGDPDNTTAMGYQRPKTLVDLLTECAESDGGILFEPRHFLGLAYRTRESLQRQGPALELSYPGHQMDSLDPVEDDLSTRNDITVTRDGGTSARQRLEAGALSVLPAPDGIGVYDDAKTLSLASDGQALPHAQWRLHLGTVDEARYPTLAVRLANQALTGSPRTVHDVLALDVGDRIVVNDPPLWVPPDPISQLVQGQTEKLGQYQHDVTWNLAPESPYHVGIYGDAGSRYTSDGSTLAAAMSSYAIPTVESVYGEGPYGEGPYGAPDPLQTISVATPSGPLWSHADGDFDVVVGGERMTVTGITGATSPQTFTVLRARNGVGTAHPEGALVALAVPVFYGL